MEEVPNPSPCVRCCPKQWPCTTRVRQRSVGVGDGGEAKEDEEEKARCDCTDMILNDRVCIGTKLTCLGVNDRKEARPQPSMPEEVHLGHYILKRVCSCCGSRIEEAGGGFGTCAWLDVKPVGHNLFDAASVLEALYQPWANDGRVCIPLFGPPNFLEEDELEAMAKKGEKTPHMLGCVKIGCADEEASEEGEKEEDEESCKWEVQVNKVVYLDFHVFVRESKVRKQGHYVSHMTSSLRITLNGVTTKLMALLSWNYEEHVDVNLDVEESQPVLLTMLTTHVRQICTRSGFAATYRLSGIGGEEELLWGRCCNRYRGWVSEFKLKQRSSSTSEGMYLASYVVTGGGQICHRYGLVCDDDDDDDDDDNKDKAARAAASTAAASAFSTFLGKEAEMSQRLFGRGAAQLQLFFREDGSIKLVDARNELFPGSLCRELYEGGRDTEHRIRQSGVLWDTVNPKEKAEVKRVTNNGLVVSEVGTLCASKQRFERRFSKGKLVYEELIGEPCQVDEAEEEEEGEEVEKEKEEKEKKKPTRRNGNARRRERKRASKQQRQQTALAFSFWRRCCTAAVVVEEEEEEEEESSSSSPPLDIITCKTAPLPSSPPSLSCSPLPSSSSSSPEPSPFLIHSSPQLKENECGLCFRDDDDDDDSDQGGEGRGSLVINAPCGHQCVCKGCAEFLQREALKQGKAHGSCLVCMADVVCWVDKVYHAARA